MQCPYRIKDANSNSWWNCQLQEHDSSVEHNYQTTQPGTDGLKVVKTEGSWFKGELPKTNPMSQT